MVAQSCRRNHGVGFMSEESGRHLEAIWDPFRSHLDAIWETSGRTLAEEASGGQISYHVPHSRTECKSSLFLFILQSVFEVYQTGLGCGFWALHTL